MRSRFWFVGAAALSGAMLLGACGATGTAANPLQSTEVPAQTTQNTQLILPTAPPMPEVTGEPTATPPPAPEISVPAGEGIQGSTNITDWTVLDTAEPYEGASVWEIVKGRIIQVSAVVGNRVQAPTALVTGDQSLSDYTVTAAALSKNNDQFGLVARASDNGFYMFSLRTDSTEDNVIIERYNPEQGTFETLATATIDPIATNQWYTLQFTVQGTSLSATVDGTPVIQAQDATLTNGQAGVMGFATGGLEFESMSVTTLASGQ